MITAGIDLGSLSAKAAIIAHDEILSWSLSLAGVDKALIGKRVFEDALLKANLTKNDIDYVISTGYGRTMVPFAQQQITEITCHAVGANWLFPHIRTVLDMGGQDCKVIKCDEKGRVLDFTMNDKCAAGTGRFFERLAVTLDVPLDSIGARSLDIVDKPASIDSTCVVFAQTDVVKILRQGIHTNDIIAGCCDAVVDRIINMIRVVGVEKELFISGGIAKNKGVVWRLEKKLSLKTYISNEPQIVGAIGAAILGQKKSDFNKFRSLR